MDDNKNQQPPTEEELKELMETIKKLEEEQKKHKKKRPSGFFVIEFGGAYHTNVIIDFMFSLLINVTLALILIEVFGLATYKNELVFIGFIAVYSVIETFFKYFITIYFIQYVIKTFGFIFFLIYLTIFYVVDQYIFTEELFNFNHEYFIVAFVTMFVLIRYFLGVNIRRRLRRMR